MSDENTKKRILEVLPEDMKQRHFQNNVKIPKCKAFIYGNIFFITEIFTDDCISVFTDKIHPM